MCSAQNGVAELPFQLLAHSQGQAAEGQAAKLGLVLKKALSCAPAVEQSWGSSRGTGSSSKPALISAGPCQAPLSPQSCTADCSTHRALLLTAVLLIPGQHVQKDSSKLPKPLCIRNIFLETLGNFKVYQGKSHET